MPTIDKKGGENLTNTRLLKEKIENSGLKKRVHSRKNLE